MTAGKAAEINAQLAILEEDWAVFEEHPELLVDTPSRKDGIDARTEHGLRVYGCELIQEAGILLRMHQTAMATGQIIFHRFYYRVSMAKCDVRAVAKAALMLASKVEEEARRPQDILNVFHASAMHRRGQRIEPQQTGTTRYFELKKELFDAESAILRELGFIVHAEHAHKFVLYYIHVLFQACEFPSELAQKAWSYANDSYRTTLCVQYRPKVLACGLRPKIAPNPALAQSARKHFPAIYLKIVHPTGRNIHYGTSAAAIFLAARALGVRLPEEPAWWELFDCDRESVVAVSTGIMALYLLPKAKWVNVRGDGKGDPGSPSKNKTKGSDAPVIAGEAAAALAAAIAKEKGLAEAAAAAVVVEDDKDDKESGERGRRSPADRRERERQRDRERERERERERDRDRDRPRDRDRRDRSRSPMSRRRSPPRRRGSRSRSPARRGSGRGSPRRDRSASPRRRSASPRRRERESERRDRGGRSEDKRSDDKRANEKRVDDKKVKENGTGGGPASVGSDRSSSRGNSPEVNGSKNKDESTRSKADRAEQPASSASSGGAVGAGRPLDMLGTATGEKKSFSSAMGDEERKRRRAEKFGTGGGEAIGEGKAEGTSGKQTAKQGEQDAGVAKQEPERKKLKVRLGQRDDLK